MSWHYDPSWVEQASPLASEALLVLLDTGLELGAAEVYLVEATVDPGELAFQEFDELLAFGRGHGPCLSQVPAVCKCVYESTVQAQRAESYLTRRLFRQILGRIERCAWHPTCGHRGGG